jgi:hypothetical protein
MSASISGLMSSSSRGRRGVAVVAGALAVAAAGAGDAHAQPAGRRADSGQGGAWLHYELSGLTVADEGRAAPRASELVLAGARLHAFVSGNASVAYHFGIDLAAGSTVRGGGFAYDVALFPIGVVVRAGETSIVGVGAGVGASGAVGTIDDAVTLPLEAIAEVGSGRVRLLARARAAYVAGADARQNGAPSIAFADELDGTVGLRIGRRHRNSGFPVGNGYFVGASYRELAGARFAGVTIGYSVDMATPRRR